MPFGSEENALAAVGMVRVVLEEPGVLRGREREEVERVREVVERVVF